MFANNDTFLLKSTHRSQHESTFITKKSCLRYFYPAALTYGERSARVTAELQTIKPVLARVFLWLFYSRLISNTE